MSRPDIRYCSGAAGIYDASLTPGRPRAWNVSFPALRAIFPSLLDHASGRKAPVLATCRSLGRSLITPSDKSTTKRTQKHLILDCTRRGFGISRTAEHARYSNQFQEL